MSGQAALAIIYIARPTHFAHISWHSLYYRTEYDKIDRLIASNKNDTQYVDTAVSDSYLEVVDGFISYFWDCSELSCILGIHPCFSRRYGHHQP